MNYTLNNEHLTISVSATGAELQTLNSTSSGEAFLWHGDQQVWSGRAPILFPIVGALKQSRMTYQGQSYSLPRHGIARRKLFSCIKHDETHLLLSLQSDTETRHDYPWDFTLEVGYTITSNRLNISYTVKNTTTAGENMLFTIGSHPAFSLPFGDTAIDQFEIRFSHPEQLQKYPLDENGLLSAHADPYPLNDGRIILHKDLFNDDALVFKNIESDTISLWQHGCERVRVNTGGAPHLGIWAKPGAPFVCIEPWFGYSDSTEASGNFADKPSLMKLAAGQSFQTDWSIELPTVLR